MSYHLVVDLGASFIASAVRRSGQVNMLPLGEAAPVIPASLAWNGSLLVAEAAERLAATDPQAVLRGVKRRVGDPTLVPLGDTEYTVQSLLAAQLRHVLQRSNQIHGGEPGRLTLTYPASWGPYRRDVMAEAGQLAGVADIRTVTNALAAATELLARRPVPTGRLIAVYDLGGGLFDAALLRRTEDGLELVGTPEGFENLGGMDFDEAVLRYVAEQLEDELDQLDLAAPSSVVALERLRRECERAKKELSTRPEVTIPVELSGRRHSVPLDRATFEELVREPIMATVDTLGTVLTRAGVDPGEVAVVLLVGWSSRIPLVARTITERLGFPAAMIDTSGHPKYMVPLGAAMLAEDEPRPRATEPAAAKAKAPDASQPSTPVVKLLLVGVLLLAVALVGVFLVRAILAVT